MPTPVFREVFEGQQGRAIAADLEPRMPPWQDRPGQSKEQYIVSEALRLMAIPRDYIRQIRPQVPIDPFPPQEGYDTTPLGIDQILDTNRWEPQRRSWVSGVIRYPRHSDFDNDMINSSMRSVGMTNPGG